MPGLFDDPTPQELMEQKRILEDLNEKRAKVNADIAKEKARQAEEPQPKRHRPEVDQFALAAKRMARNKPMPQPEAQPEAQTKVRLTPAASSSDPPPEVSMIHESELCKINRTTEKKDDGTTVVHEYEEKQTDRTSIRFPIHFGSHKHVVAAGAMQMIRAKGSEIFQSFRTHFTNEITVKDLKCYPWVHFIIPKICRDAQNALALEIQKLDKGALIDFIEMDHETSLLVMKNRTTKLGKLVKHNLVERLVKPAKKGRAADDEVETMLIKRTNLGRDRFTNFWLQQTESEKYPNHVFQYDELLTYLDKTLTKGREVDDFDHRIEDARQARSGKQQTPIQHALLVSETKLRQYVEGTVRSSAMTFSAKEPDGRTKWEDYPEAIKNIKGMYWDPDAKQIKWVTMWDYTVAMALERCAWVIGGAGKGKSTLQGVWSRFWCRSCTKNNYLYGKAIDPVGAMCRDNKMQDIGALCLADFKFTTLMKTKMDHEDILGLCGVFELGQVPARYSCANLPKGLRRAFSANLGKDPVTHGPDPGHYFEEFNIPSLAKLARNDEAGLKASSDEDEALARRCVVFVLPVDIDLRVDTQAVEDKMVNILAQEQLNRDMCC